MYRKITAVLLTLTLAVSGMWIIPNKTAGAESGSRIYGQSEFQTIAAISRAGWPTTSENVILASIENFPDALSGAPLAYLKNAPILLTGHDSLDVVIFDEIKRLRAKNIFILGGTGAVSKGIEDELTSNGCHVQRIYGDDRYKTAIEVGKYLKSDTVVVATGENYPDALAIGPFAASKQYPILFTEKDSLNLDTKKVLTDWHVKNAIIVGGVGVVSQSVYDEMSRMGIKVERLAGDDRYLTALSIIKHFDDGSFKGIYAATGEDFPDALAGGPLAAKNNYPIFMVGKDYVDSNMLQYINWLNLKDKTYILGGFGAISDNTANSIIAGETITPPQVDTGTDSCYGRITEGTDCTMVVLNDGTLWGWGKDDDRYFGLRDNAPRTVLEKPQKMMDNVKMVSSSERHTLVVKKDGTLWGWGLDMPNYKEERFLEFLKPTKLMDGVKSAVSGNAHSLVLKNDGTVWVWGYYQNGQMNGRTGNKPGYVPIKVFDNARAIAASGNVSYVIGNDGKLWSWGQGAVGELDAASGKKLVCENVKAVYQSGGLAVLKEDGTLWITAGFGDVFTDDIYRYEYYSEKLHYVTDNVKTASAGTDGLYVVKNDGTLITWRDNLGMFNSWEGMPKYNGSTDTSASREYYIMSDVEAVLSGVGYSIAVKKDGTVWGWGSNRKINNRYSEVGYTEYEYLSPMALKFSSDLGVLFQGEDSLSSDYLSDYMKDWHAEWDSQGYGYNGGTYNWNGTWNTTIYSPVTIKQSGNEIVALGVFGDVVFSGTLSGNILRSHYQDNFQISIFEIALSSDGKTFKGLLFTDCADKPQEFIGEKIE